MCDNKHDWPLINAVVAQMKFDLSDGNEMLDDLTDLLVKINEDDLRAYLSPTLQKRFKKVGTSPDA
jgi:hypothetical protein